MIAQSREAAYSALRNGKPVFSCKREDDRRLAERIYYGVIQNERFLNTCISFCTEKPIQKMQPQVLTVLQLSAYQLLFLSRIPESAVVNDAVNLCRKNRMGYASGFVNAVLRRICREKADLLERELAPAVRYSHPDWLADMLCKEFGEEKTAEYMKANQQMPRLRLQINLLRCSLDGYCGLLESNGISVLNINPLLSSVLIDSQPVHTLPGYAEGLFYIQDDAAREAVRLAEPLQDKRILDVCAAPGGKSCAAAIAGGNVLACDVSPDRLQRCRENFSRLGLAVPTRQVDATMTNPQWIQHFDLVFADVPCTGSGVIRKHPEIRRKSRVELESLLNLQKDILENVSQYVKPGGKLLYSTCSVLKEEDEDQIACFLRNHVDYDLEREPMRSWPQDLGNDGFFTAVLRRKL